MWAGAGELPGFVISQNLSAAGEIHTLHRSFACCLSTIADLALRRGEWYSGAVREGPRSTKWSGMEHSRAAWGPRGAIPVPPPSKECLASFSSAACVKT